MRPPRMSHPPRSANARRGASRWRDSWRRTSNATSGSTGCMVRDELHQEAVLHEHTRESDEFHEEAPTPGRHRTRGAGGPGQEGDRPPGPGPAVARRLHRFLRDLLGAEHAAGPVSYTHLTLP